MDVAGDEGAEKGAPECGGHDHGPSRPPAPVDERPEGRCHDGERPHGEQEVENHLVLRRRRGDGEEQRPGERNGEERVPRRHEDVGQGQAPERATLIEEVGDGRAGQAAELIASLAHTHLRHGRRR